VHGYAPSVGSGTGYDGAYRCDKPTHVPCNSLVLEAGAWRWRWRCRARTTPAAGFLTRRNRINCQFCITEHSELLPKPEAGKLSACALA